MAAKEYSIRKIANNPGLLGIAKMENDIVYSTATGTPLKLALLRKWDAEEPLSDAKYPLIVFVQGSAWTFPNIYSEIPQLSRYAQNGYVVATVTHRNCLEGHPFPAFLQDVKTAIRFLRKNAEAYHIDPERVCIWGTSSGGNTAMLVGLTGDDPRYRTDEYPEYSDAVKTVVQCFGPTDIYRMCREMYRPELDEPGQLMYELCGGHMLEHREILEQMSPICHVDSCKSIPPMLMLQGDADPVVHYDQCESMFRALAAKQADVEMVCVQGAPHEGSFWSEELHEIIRSYIAAHL